MKNQTLNYREKLRQYRIRIWVLLLSSNDNRPILPGNKKKTNLIECGIDGDEKNLAAFAYR